MTTPQQKLNEIEQQIKVEYVYMTNVIWLFERVKQLEASLDRLLKSEVIQGAEFLTYSEAYHDANKALTTLPGEKNDKRSCP